jgi:CRP-like cAMP-binding protein
MNLLEIFEDSEDLVEFPAGSTIFKEGVEGLYMFVVIEGEVSLSLHDKELATALPGDIVGEMALINSDIRSATATAVTDSLLAVIDEKSFKMMLKHVPDFSMHIMNVMAERLGVAYELLGH